MNKEINAKKKEITLDALVEQIVDRKLEEKLKSRQATGTPDENKWLTVGLASKEFGCSAFALERAIANNEIDSYRPEGRTYLKRKDVAAWLESIRIRANSGVNEYEFLTTKK